VILKIENKDNFLNDFLAPIGKVADNAVIKIEPKKISSLVTSGDSTIITYSEYIDNNIDLNVTLNLPEVKKFVKLLSCIEGNLELSIDTNNISYKSPSVRFKYHLYDDGIIPVPSLNLSKLSAIEFDGKFTTTLQKINGLLKGSIFTDSNEKVYFSINDNQVEVDITDKTRDNTNSFASVISEDYSGIKVINSLPFKFDIIQHISQYKSEIYKVELSSKFSILTFTLNNENVMTKFIVSALKS
jgi:hypothetical protein